MCLRHILRASRKFLRPFSLLFLHALPFPLYVFILFIILLLLLWSMRAFSCAALLYDVFIMVESFLCPILSSYSSSKKQLAMAHMKNCYEVVDKFTCHRFFTSVNKQPSPLISLDEWNLMLRTAQKGNWVSWS